MEIVLAKKLLNKPRDYNAMDACLRKGGPMKDRREPRGGSKNSQAEYLKEVEDGFECDFCGILSATVLRVALDSGYDRILTKISAKYACPACSVQKEKLRLSERAEDAPEAVIS